MRLFSPTVLWALAAATPLVSAAGGQFDFLQNIFSQFADSIPRPGHAAATESYDKTVLPLNLSNYRSFLHDEQANLQGRSVGSKLGGDWWVLITGGNKTCYGLCKGVEASFNTSIPKLAKGPSPPHLAILNCESSPQLCNAWIVSPPSILHIEPPATANQPTTVRYIYLNHTTTTPDTFISLQRDREWEKVNPYEGYFHPFDGPLAKSGANIVWGYITWTFALVPSWLFMLLVSFGSRTFLGRRTQPQRGGATPAGAPGPVPAGN